MSSLVLSPKPEIATTPNLENILIYLQQHQFVGIPLQNHLQQTLTSHNFLVGEAFLHLITFMGCSPYIELEPQLDGKSFCYIHIDGPWTELQLRYSDKTQSPRCHICHKRITTWKETLELWLAQPINNIIECPHCSNKQSLLDLSWRKDAGCGYLFINVENIFPGEAVPVPKFLTKLATITNTTWQYFYIQS